MILTAIALTCLVRIHVESTKPGETILQGVVVNCADDPPVWSVWQETAQVTPIEGFWRASLTGQAGKHMVCLMADTAGMCLTVNLEPEIYDEPEQANQDRS